MEQLRSYWTDTHKIWHVSVFRESTENNEFWLQYDKDTLHLELRSTIMRATSLILIRIGKF